MGKKERKNNKNDSMNEFDDFSLSIFLFLGSLPRAALLMLGESLLRLDLSENELSHMEDGALLGLEQLFLLNISRNDLSRFNSDVFKGT